MLDLGSGSGMDVFAAATQVGPNGSVIGVDITPEQLAKAERLSRDEHVSFRAARIEELPFEDSSFDAVISNGVVNLSADKRRVFAEAARVLRPGGRLALADIVTEREIAERTSRQADLWAACIAGASQIDLYLERHRGRRPRAARDPRATRPTASRASGRSARATSTALDSVSLLAHVQPPPSHPDGGADVAHAAEEVANTTTTQEVSK